MGPINGRDGASAELLFQLLASSWLSECEWCADVSGSGCESSLAKIMLNDVLAHMSDRRIINGRN